MADDEDNDEELESTEKDSEGDPRSSDEKKPPAELSIKDFVTGENVVQVNFGGPAVAQDESSETNPDAKLRIFIDMIETGMVGITVDARRAEVQVPFRFRDESQLVLNFSHKFYLDDFEYDDYGVRATLSFQGHPSFVDIPWSAVWMLRSQQDGTTIVIPEDIPPELVSAPPQPVLTSVPTGADLIRTGAVRNIKGNRKSVDAENGSVNEPAEASHQLETYPVESSQKEATGSLDEESIDPDGKKTSEEGPPAFGEGLRLVKEDQQPP